MLWFYLFFSLFGLILILVLFSFINSVDTVFWLFVSAKASFPEELVIKVFALSAIDVFVFEEFFISFFKLLLLDFSLLELFNFFFFWKQFLHFFEELLSFLKLKF